MNAKSANNLLSKSGFSGLFVNKADGFWYLLGDDGVKNLNVERCLHVVRLSDLTEDVLAWKLNELTRVGGDE